MTLCILFSSRLFFFPARLYYCRLENRRTHITPPCANVSIPQSHYFKVAFSVSVTSTGLWKRTWQVYLHEHLFLSSLCRWTTVGHGPSHTVTIVSIHPSGSEHLILSALVLLRCLKLKAGIRNSQSTDIPKRRHCLLHMGPVKRECIIDFISITALKAAVACLSRS